MILNAFKLAGRVAHCDRQLFFPQMAIPLKRSLRERPQKEDHYERLWKVRRAYGYCVFCGIGFYSRRGFPPALAASTGRFEFSVPEPLRISLVESLIEEFN